jgi:hypothetical protein
MNEKMEVNINARFLWRSCTNLDCFPFLECCSGHEGVVASIYRSQVYQPMFAIRSLLEQNKKKRRATGTLLKEMVKRKLFNSSGILEG